jgi:hypothetical protein
MTRFLSILVCAAMLVAGCRSNPTDPDAVSFPVSLALKAGESQLVGRGLLVKFVGVTDDWRCPITALCISAGDASLQFEFATDGRFRSQELRVLDPQLRKFSFEGYSIDVKQLEPGRDISVLMAQRDYKVTIEVSR